MGRRLAWVLPLLVLIVVAAGIGTGFGVRELASPSGTVTPPPPVGTSAGPPPGPPTVGLSADAAAHPEGRLVQSLLQRHFDAINQRDYQAWISTVVARRSAEMPYEDWLAAYESTEDGGMLVRRIEPGPTGLVVLLSFTSVQDAAHAPVSLPGATCANWDVSYRVVEERGQRRIDLGVPNSAIVSRCD